MSQPLKTSLCTDVFDSSAHAIGVFSRVLSVTECYQKNVTANNMSPASRTVNILQNVYRLVLWRAPFNGSWRKHTGTNQSLWLWHFGYWCRHTSGVYKDESTSVWGLNVLTFNEKGLIDEVASVYQPFPGMREALLKAWKIYSWCIQPHPILKILE